MLVCVAERVTVTEPVFELVDVLLLVCVGVNEPESVFEAVFDDVRVLVPEAVCDGDLVFVGDSERETVDVAVPVPVVVIEAVTVPLGVVEKEAPAVKLGV